jgi:hypothetical protein
MPPDSSTLVPMRGGLMASSPPGFVVPHRALPIDREGPCADCGARLTVAATFTGGGVCRTCDRRRERVAALLAAVIRGAVPEDLTSPAAGETISDELERAELRDHVDVLLAAHRAPLAVAA